MDKEDLVHSHTHTMECYLAMDGFGGYALSDRQRKMLCEIPYVWNPKGNDADELTKQKDTHRLREQTYGCW